MFTDQFTRPFPQLYHFKIEWEKREILSKRPIKQIFKERRLKSTWDHIFHYEGRFQKSRHLLHFFYEIFIIIKKGERPMRTKINQIIVRHCVFGLHISRAQSEKKILLYMGKTMNRENFFIIDFFSFSHSLYMERRRAVRRKTD